MINNIFVHDAVPTWSGFLYQGQIAVYLAVKKIYELDASGKRDEVDCYAIEMEKCEDIAIVYEKKGCKKYHSIHQAKNCAKQRIGDYKNPLTQLMLEKGFCQKNEYGVPDAYLHVSEQLLINSGEIFEEKMEEWQSEISIFYKTLCELHEELKQDLDTDEVVRKLGNCVNSQPIAFNRTEYKKILEKVKKACGEEKDFQRVKKGLDTLLSFLRKELYVLEINKDVKIYNYDGKTYCSGTEIFTYIVKYVIKYKCNRGKFSREQYEYIADKMLCFVEKKILERHQLMQEGKEASCSIPLCEFMKILDESIERYEEEANILTLIRQYDERLEAYCSICRRKKECLGENCRLQQPDSRRNMLKKDTFVKLCYNLNPECVDTITDRA